MYMLFDIENKYYYYYIIEINSAFKGIINLN